MLRCLSFTNALWGSDREFGSAVTYWSLGFEAVYYVLFAIAVFARGWTRAVLFVLAAAAAGPRIMALFPAWLLGCGCYALCRRRIGWGWGLFLLPVVAFAVLVRRDAFLPIVHGLGYSARPLVLAYAVAGLFALHLIGARAISLPLERALGWAGGPIRWLANTTFTLYLLHVPLSFMIRSWLPVDASPGQAAAVLLPGVLSTTFLIAGVTEKRKQAWRNACLRLIPAAQPPAVPCTLT